MTFVTKHGKIRCEIMPPSPNITKANPENRAATRQTGANDDIDYYPFGGERAYVDHGDNNYKFTGKDRDSESNLDDFGARYYSSQIGRFMSVDPGNAGADPSLPQSWNMYTYALGNPLGIVDPDGMDPCVTAQGAASPAEGSEITAGDCQQKARQTCPVSACVTASAPRSFFSRIFGKMGDVLDAAAVPFIRWGRLGGPAHRAAVRKISDRLKEEGYDVNPEVKIKTPNGAKSYRFVDVQGTKPGEPPVYYQVGRENADGTPVAREVQAMDDIQGATTIRPNFVPYNTSEFEGPSLPILRATPGLPTSDGELPEGELPEGVDLP